MVVVAGAGVAVVVWFSSMNIIFCALLVPSSFNRPPVLNISSPPRQTTNGIYNTSLYDAVRPQSVPAWQRVRTACALARNGEEWSTLIAKHNSGTYNNQYMVLNVGLFRPGEALAPGMLWVSEQIPGLVVSEDVTHELERGYWPSYNVPYFDKVRRADGGLTPDLIPAEF